MCLMRQDELTLAACGSCVGLFELEFLSFIKSHFHVHCINTQISIIGYSDANISSSHMLYHNLTQNVSLIKIPSYVKKKCFRHILLAYQVISVA